MSNLRPSNRSEEPRKLTLLNLMRIKLLGEEVGDQELTQMWLKITWLRILMPKAMSNLTRMVRLTKQMMTPSHKGAEGSEAAVAVAHLTREIRLMSMRSRETSRSRSRLEPGEL